MSVGWIPVRAAAHQLRQDKHQDMRQKTQSCFIRDSDSSLHTEVARVCVQLLVFWTLSIVQSLFKNNVSETLLSPSSGKNLLSWAQSTELVSISGDRLIISLISHRHKLLDPIYVSASYHIFSR
jgi:hypothetical protein